MLLELKARGCCVTENRTLTDKRVANAETWGRFCGRQTKIWQKGPDLRRHTSANARHDLHVAEIARRQKVQTRQISGSCLGNPRSTAKSCNQCKLSWILHKLHESAICARFKMSIWYLQVVDTAYSKVRKSALANSINLGCQKHFWRAISAGRVLGVKGRRVLILYLSLFWCLANLPLISFISEPKHYHLSNEPWHDTFSI